MVERMRVAQARDRNIVEIDVFELVIDSLECMRRGSFGLL
jgi:hypothetical protein